MTSAQSAIAALFLYASLPILRNTYAGITEVDAQLIEAARVSDVLAPTLGDRLDAAFFEAGPGPYCLVARPASGIPDLEATCRTANGWTDEKGNLRLAIGGGHPDRVAIVGSDDSAFTVYVSTERPRWRSAAGLVSWYADWHPREAVADLAILRHGESAATISLPVGTLSDGDRDGDVTWNVGELSAGQDAR